jgi:hypothetical protein
MIYWIHGKKFCKCNNVPPLHTKKNLLETIPGMGNWGIKANVGVGECNHEIYAIL